MGITAFLPVRKGSERVKSKNTRKFSDSGSSLLQIKIEQLLTVKGISRIVVSTNDEAAIEAAREFEKDKIVIDVRPEWLCLSETKISDLTLHAARVCRSETILWTHVTSPLFTGEHYSAAISEMEAKSKVGFDSLATVKRLKEFVLDQNFTPLQDLNKWTMWPRTQDLDPLFVLNSAMFLAPKSFYELGARLGDKPFFLVCEDVPSLDVNTDFDWDVAQVMFRGTN